ncbi:MAG: response regulator [Candidatus Rokuibacteriota bacterium]
MAFQQRCDQPRLSGMTILVVEDHADSREALAEILRYFGARTLLARDGADALAALASVVPDVVLCDLSMPVMDGFGFLERVRQDPRLAHLPVIATTALGSRADRSRTRRAGFAGHAVKPIEADALVARLARWAGSRRHCAA